MQGRDFLFSLTLLNVIFSDWSKRVCQASRQEVWGVQTGAT